MTIPEWDDTNILSFVIVRYAAKPFDHFDPLIPVISVANENPLDERTNYLTDDSDSDLEVFLDA